MSRFPESDGLEQDSFILLLKILVICAAVVLIVVFI